MTVDAKILEEMITMAYGATHGTIKGFSEVCVSRLELEIGRVQPEDLRALVDSYNNSDCQNCRHVCRDCPDSRQIKYLVHKIEQYLDRYEQELTYSLSGC